MTLEPWALVAAGCAAIGIAALAAKLVLRLIDDVQERRLEREGRALERWWTVISEVPPAVLTPPLRRLLGRIMIRSLNAAARVDADHPYLREQRDEINRFAGSRSVNGSLHRARNRSQGQVRERELGALQELLDLLDHCPTDRLVSAEELASARAAVARALTDLEFLATRRTHLEADALRRMTRAIGQGAESWARQSSSALPTQ